MPVLASNTRLRRRAPARAPLRARRRRRPGASSCVGFRPMDRNALGRELRAQGRVAPLGRPLGRAASLEVARAVIVLHVQKVAGISGSEAHLLQLLPDLKARGWDIRFLMLHEQEPGAWEFARALEAGGVPVDGIAMNDRRRPGHVRPRSLLPRQPPPDDPAHPSRSRRRLRADGGHARRRADPPLDQARLQRVPRGPHLRARRPHDRRARAPPDRDLARARALPLRDGGLPRAGLRDRPLRDRRRARAGSRMPATRRASSASGA